MAKQQRICSIPDCGKPSKSKGYCWGHYARLRTHGDPLGKRQYPEPKPCSVDGCGSKSIARGYCSAHWQRWKTYSDPEFVFGNPVWTDEKLSVVREHYPNMSTKDFIAAHMPEMTQASVFHAAKKLGLKKSGSARKARYAALKGQTPWNKGKVVSFTCEICGSSSEMTEAKTGNGTRRYCSKECTHEAKRRVFGPGHKLYKKVDRSCEWCGSAFLAKPAKIKVGEGRFCSRQCVGAYASSLQEGRRSSIEVMIEEGLIETGVDFVAQKKMAHFLCDFYIPSAKLVVECDGDYWHAKPDVAERDARKDAWLISHGQRVIRLSETDIKADRDECIGRILDLVS